MELRHAQHPERRPLRKALAEHPFAAMKRWMDQCYFLCRRLGKVGAKFFLTVFVCSLKRAMNIVGRPA